MMIAQGMQHSASVHRTECSARLLQRRPTCSLTENGRRGLASQRSRKPNRHHTRETHRCNAAPEGTGYPKTGDLGQVRHGDGVYSVVPN